MSSDEDSERAEAYILIGHLFKAPPSVEVLEMLGDFTGDDTALGQAVAQLAARARLTTPAEAAGEFADLFTGLSVREEVSPYASVQRTGSLFGETLVALRGDLAAFGVARSDDVKEPEDHVSAICEVMAGLLRGQFGLGASADDIRAFFKNHVQPWMPKFVRAVEETKGIRLYADVAMFARLFIEREAARYN